MRSGKHFLPFYSSAVGISNLFGERFLPIATHSGKLRLSLSLNEVKAEDIFSMVMTAELRYIGVPGEGPPMHCRVPKIC